MGFEVSPKDKPPEPSHDSRELSLGERVFVGADGRLRPAIRAVSFGIVAFLASTLAGAMAAPLLSDLPSTLQLAILSTVSVGTTCGATWCFLHFGDGAAWDSPGLSFRRSWLKRIAAGTGIGFALQLGIAAALTLTHAQHYDFLATWDARSWAKLACDVWLFAAAAAAEELLFRGYALQRLIGAAGAPLAVVASSIAFGLAHIWNPGANLFSTLNTVLAGILLSVAYLRTRDMWLQCGLHAAWNFFMGPIFCFPVSGLVFGPQTFVTHLTGAAWWSGGPYGPEAGAVGSVALLGGIVWVSVGFREAVLPRNGEPE